jgi:hypothetical protein
MVEPSKLRFLSILLFFEFLSLVFVGFFLTVDINYLLFFFSSGYYQSFFGLRLDLLKHIFHWVMATVTLLSNYSEPKTSSTLHLVYVWLNK